MLIFILIGVFVLWKFKSSLGLRIPSIIYHLGFMTIGVFVYQWLMKEAEKDNFNLSTLKYYYFVIYGVWIYIVFKGYLPKTGTPKVQKTEVFEFTSDRKKKNRTIENPYRGTIVVGGAGSGKSKTFIYPIIKQSAEKGFTGVLYDFKSPELIDYTRLCYQNTDIKTQTIDFKDLNNSSRINPIAYVESAIHATNYTQALIFNLMPEYIQKQDFWSRSMLSIFSGAMWYFKKNQPELATLPHIFTFFFLADAKTIVKFLSQDIEIKGYISSLIEAVDQGAEKQVAGVLGTLKNAIGVYNNPQIYWLLSKDEINMNVNDPNNKTMLLVGNNSSLADTYAPLCSMIITVASKLMNEPNKEKSVILIDESPTIYLPNFEQIPATARSNRVAVVVGTQDISQMVDKYGKDKTEVLISNLGNQFYGRTTNRETAERVVSMFGQREDIVITESLSDVGHLGFGKKGKSQSIQRRDNIKIQEMSSLNPGEFASILAQGKDKMFLAQYDAQKEVKETGVKPLQSSVNSYDLDNNFKRIYKDIERVLSLEKLTKEEEMDF